MDRCFVIQPFDAVFDKRYNETFEKAIRDAGLDPYRIDKDPATKIIIEDIEKEIQDAKVCFAEITTDNPNVWYELGFAFACGKDVVMVCEKSKRQKYPFDIQHRAIIEYSTDSKGDYEKLEKDITKKIEALLSSSPKKRNSVVSSVKESEELKQGQVELMRVLLNELATSASVPKQHLCSGMREVGYSDSYFEMSFIALKRLEMIEITEVYDSYSSYIVCKLTDKGETWVIENQNKIPMRNDDIPF